MEINIQNRFTETDRLSVRRHQMCTWSSSDKKKRVLFSNITNKNDSLFYLHETKISMGAEVVNLLLFP